MYTDVVIPKPDLSDDKYFMELPEAVREGFNRTRWGWRFDTPEKYQFMMKGYYRMISAVDAEIGKIREKLKERGLDKNTVIIFMGDNGYFLGERQLADKWLMYDLSVRVPMMIYDPRVEKHQDIDRMTLNIDIPATITDLAGIPQHETWHGESLVPIVAGKVDKSDRDTILIEHLWEMKEIPSSEGVRTSDWKYFRYVNDKSSEELYSLKNDGREIVNLADKAKYRDILEQMRASTDNLIAKYADPYSGVPSKLRVEYIRSSDAVGVNDSLPEYSWEVPQQAVFQKGYQILVASTKSNIDNNTGDVWDSGQVRKSQSTNIEHRGAVLKPQTKYYWKVRIWDNINRTSEYSPCEAFTTGDFAGRISTANIFHIEKLSPVALHEIGKNSYFADFGKAAFAGLEIKYKATKSDTITIRLGETIINGRINMNPGGSIRYCELKLAVNPKQEIYKVDLPKDKRNTSGAAVLLPDEYGTVMPFRYCEVDNFEDQFTSKSVTQTALFNYFDKNTGNFTCSDTILNQIWDICKYTIKATTFAGVYVDGDRERIPYEADAYINQLSHYGVDSEYAMAKQTIEHFMMNPTWPTEWLLHTVMLAYQDYYYTGDTELIQRYYNTLKDKTLIALARQDGLISSASEKVTEEYMSKLGFQNTKSRIRDIVDWPGSQKESGWKVALPQGERDGHEMLPINTVVNSFFYLNMIMMAELAEVINRREDRDNFLQMAAKVRQSINQKLFDKQTGRYIDGEGSSHSSIHSNMLPLAFGIIEKANVKGVVEYIKSRGMGCSVYGAQYLFEALYNAEEAQYALDLMRNTTDRGWYNMIRVGSTMTMEAWDMKHKPNSDWNHAWGAAPANLIPRQMWGITPLTPGFGIARIKPQLADLTHSSITIPTIKGEISCRYKRDGANKTYTVSIPANMGAEFVLPSDSDSEITFNGKKVSPIFDTLQLVPGVNEIEIKVNTF